MPRQIPMVATWMLCNFKAHLMRSYPENDLASTVLGFVTEDNHGYMGVEEKYDNILAGIPVTVLVPADPRRAVEYPHIPPGQTLILTIDREIQASIEKILDNALASTGVRIRDDHRHGPEDR